MTHGTRRQIPCLCAAAALVVLASFRPAAGDDSDAAASPIGKVLSMIDDLQAKIIKEGEKAHKEYAGYAEWCEEKSMRLKYEIKTSKGIEEELKATIEEESSLVQKLTTKVDDLSGKIASADKSLEEATALRKTQAADFAAEEKELLDTISALKRATKIVTQQGAAFVQLPRMSAIIQAFETMVQASVLSTADAQRLTSLVQTSDQSSEDSDDADSEGAVNAPDAAVYESHTANIIETLEGLLDKAETQLDAARQAESKALHNYNMLKTSLDDEIRVANQEMGEAKTNIAASNEKSGVATGDLDVTTKDLSSDIADLSEVHKMCMTTAQDFEAATNSRNDEIQALAEAKRALKEMTGNADELEYGLGQVSLMQLGAKTSRSSGGSDSRFAVVRFLLELADHQNSRSLAQIASRVSAAIRSKSRSHADPFAKVKGLITDMISKLESEASADASHKAYCDKETSEITTKKNEKTAELEKLTTGIDVMTSRIAVLDEEVATLLKELADIAKSQAGYDKWYMDLEETYKVNKEDMQEGIEGVKLALKVIRDYYAKDDKSHDAAEGAGTGIIGLLEVVESDFTKTLAEMEESLLNQKAGYETTTKDNEITTAAKKQDVKYKTQEMNSLKKALSEATSDQSGVKAELAAVLEQLDKINEMCVAKAEPYEEKKLRRDKEIAGLKEALAMLEGEALFLQTGSVHHAGSLRGVRQHRIE
jgi:hypothetical protein